MSITATELKMNLGKYLLLSEKEDIYITKNGKVIAKLSCPFPNRIDMVNSMVGIIPKDIDVDRILSERCNKV